MNPNILKALEIIMSLLPIAQTIMTALAMIAAAQREGRDITNAELATLKAKRKTATKKFLDSTEPT